MNTVSFKISKLYGCMILILAIQFISRPVFAKQKILNKTVAWKSFKIHIKETRRGDGTGGGTSEVQVKKANKVMSKFTHVKGEAVGGGREICRYPKRSFRDKYWVISCQDGYQFPYYLINLKGDVVKAKYMPDLYSFGSDLLFFGLFSDFGANVQFSVFDLAEGKAKFKFKSQLIDKYYEHLKGNIDPSHKVYKYKKSFYVTYSTVKYFLQFVPETKKVDKVLKLPDGAKPLKHQLANYYNNSYEL